MTSNQQVVMRQRPHGKPSAADFDLVERPTPAPGPGEVLVETAWLSLDPYMRGRMAAGPSYASPLEPGDVITGEVVGRVSQSCVPDIPAGSFVRAPSGWQSHAVHAASAVHVVDPGKAPLSAYLGVLGMPGLTAYAGLHELGRPKASETLVVAAATGPVGSLVGQLAKRLGVRTVGIAGGADKVEMLAETFGFDVALDHRSANFDKALRAACPGGVDVYVELVGGHVFDAVLPLLNVHARIPVIGTVAHYNATESAPGPDRMPMLMRQILVKRLAVEGLIVWDFEHLRPRFVDEMAALIRVGAIRYVEDVTEGLAAAPEAFIGLLEGANRGKALVRVAEP
ncbi:MAG: NADP-dependent oxidoreductase [Pseudomonadota bacterium]